MITGSSGSSSQLTRVHEVDLVVHQVIHSVNYPYLELDSPLHLDRQPKLEHQGIRGQFRHSITPRSGTLRISRLARGSEYTSMGSISSSQSQVFFFFLAFIAGSQRSTSNVWIRLPRQLTLSSFPAGETKLARSYPSPPPFRLSWRGQHTFPHLEIILLRTVAP